MNDDKADQRLLAGARALWQTLEGTITGTSTRPCAYLRRPITLAVADGMPAVCLDTHPLREGTVNCGVACSRHLSMLGALRRLRVEATPGSPRPVALLPYLLKIEREHWVQRGFQLEDGAPLTRPVETLEVPRTYGVDGPYNASGLPGYTHSITDEEVEAGAIQAAAAKLEACVSESDRSGRLRHLHLELAPGRLWASDRNAVDVPEVRDWIRKLQGHCPDLCFHIDPGSAQLLYGALFPDDVFEDGVRVDLQRLSTEFGQSASAAVEGAVRSRLAPDRIEGLVVQALRAQDLWLVVLGGGDVEQFFRYRLETAMSAGPVNLAAGAEGPPMKMLSQALLEAMTKSFNDGELHNPGTVANGVLYHFDTFPCDMGRAREYYRQHFGTYARYLEACANHDASLLDILKAPVLCQIVACAAGPLELELRVAWYDRELARVLEPSVEP